MDAVERFDRTRRKFVGLVDAFRHDEEGATAIEYGLIVALIFLAIVGGVRAFTSSASDMYDEIDQTLQST
jgi:pilus assembly protein Flp/PilA